uniref:Uncharacterized protein n=1 Tax=Timema tahoe TaxID=61484 RepID=A0A7R9FGZ4_9NEOP|nr:unnamed protein product [Timema tahoe]
MDLFFTQVKRGEGSPRGDNATASRCYCRRRVFDDGGAVPWRVVVMLLVATMSGTYTNSHRDGLRLRLSDPTLGTSLLSGGSLGSEDSEEEGVEGSRGGGGGVANWTWTHRTVPVSGIRKAIFRGCLSTLTWRESGKTFLKTTLSTPDRDSNLDFPVIESLVYCESSASDQVRSHFQRCSETCVQRVEQTGDPASVNWGMGPPNPPPPLKLLAGYGLGGKD